ncbi:hypothetical protein KC722_01435, partial [Candidatus Kaiserbacteria bacterium]|nr:hypothetical protein [Candidatus Kaiserbacteria bacterium]
MKILSIETSCDETAVSVVEALGDFPNAKYEVLGNALFSQIETHRQYGGVFPMMAKREHAVTLVPMLEEALAEAKLIEKQDVAVNSALREEVSTILEREPSLSDQLLTYCDTHTIPDIGLIAVTSGPGLEPA